MKKILEQIGVGIVLLLALLTVIFMVGDLLHINRCSKCKVITIGKQDAIKDKPVCEECYNERYK